MLPFNAIGLSSLFPFFLFFMFIAACSSVFGALHHGLLTASFSVGVSCQYGQKLGALTDPINVSLTQSRSRSYLVSGNSYPSYDCVVLSNPVMGKLCMGNATGCVPVR